MGETTSQARQDVARARTALSTEVDELDLAVRSAVDIPAKIRRNPGARGDARRRSRLPRGRWPEAGGEQSGPACPASEGESSRPRCFRRTSSASWRRWAEATCRRRSSEGSRTGSSRIGQGPGRERNGSAARGARRSGTSSTVSRRPSPHGPPGSWPIDCSPLSPTGLGRKSGSRARRRHRGVEEPAAR